MPQTPEASRATKQLNGLISEFHELDASDQADVLTELGAANSQIISKFHCPTTNVKAIATCALTSCPYFASKAYGSCLLWHKFNSGKNSISAEELSQLSDIPVQNIKASVEASFNALRANAILSEINAGDYNRFDYIENINVCVCCGSLITKKSFQANCGGLNYCGKPCYKKKPPTLVCLEVKFRTDIRVILSVALKQLKKLPLIAGALGVKRRLLLQWYSDYLRVSANQFGTDAVGYADLLRKPVVSYPWVLEFLSGSFSKNQFTVPKNILDLEQETKLLCKSL